MQRTHAVVAAFATILVFGPALASHAQEGQEQQPVKPGQEQGLGLTGPEVPQALKDAQANPYGLPTPVSCATLSQHIADLDRVLGPDLDSPQMEAKKDKTEDLMAGVRAVLPYGGIVRTLTGAGKKEQALVNAALASWERRGYLKGLAHSRGCQLSGVATPAAAVVRVSQPTTTAPVSTGTPAKKKKKKKQ